MNINYLSSQLKNRLSPFAELQKEMNQLLDDFWVSPSQGRIYSDENTWTPACDVEEAQGHFLLTLDLPGINKEDIKLEISDHQLTIAGERRREKKEGGNDYWYTERRHGKFARTFTLPSGVDFEKVEAQYQDGTLKIYVPKIEAAKPRQIKISHGSGPGLFGRLIGQSQKDSDKDKVAS